jgi:gamma-glutamyltranspeptidase/glutathione hydrolase
MSARVETRVSGAPRRGGVASPHWAATRVGEQVLADGGNALDACVATNAALSVVYPHMSGVGGDLFLLHFDAASGRLHALDGSGRAPALATIEAYRERGLAAVPERGPLSVTVPGVVHAWETALGRFGSRSLAELLEPARRMAADGYVVTERLAGWMERSRETLAADPVLRRWFLTPDGSPVAPGATVRVPELAELLGLIGEGGSEAFYRGELAAAVDAAMRDAGGLLRRQDLERHESTWVEPLRLRYRGLEVCTTPPPSQGITGLSMLAMLESDTQLPPGGVEQIERLVHVKRAAFADRDRYLTDPSFADVPVELMLDPAREWDAVAGPADAPVGGDTVYLCAVDRHGNACSVIQSIYYGFGSGHVPGDTGMLLHNRGHYFSLDAARANRLEPGKRTMHTLIASMALRDGRPWLVFGTMGADGQPQITVQVLERVLAGATAQEAVGAPRVLAGRFVLSDDVDRLLVEQDCGEEVIAALLARGHAVERAPARDERLGHAHAIRVREDGGLDVGVDPRSDGLARVL